MTLPAPGAADVRALAAYLVWALRRKSPPSAIPDRLDLLHGYLQTHENLAPVRVVWLASDEPVARRCTGAWRGRDRLLQRLFDGGLRAGQDLPSFLISAGPSADQPFQTAGKWLSQMAEMAREWIGKQGPEWTTQACTPRTRDYSDLLFAYGLARRGERDACQRLRDRAPAFSATKIWRTSCCFRASRIASSKPSKGKRPAVPSLPRCWTTWKNYVPTAKYKKKTIRKRPIMPIW